MATAHIESNLEDIAPVVLMPGDPLRAKYIAENFLEDYKLVNSVRNMYGYTGFYKGVKITVFASGMGIPSIGIYAYELFKFYNVQKIIRIGTCGSNSPDIKILDIVLANSAYSLNSFPMLFDGDTDKEYMASTILNNSIIETANAKSLDIHAGKIITSDVFDVYVDFDKYISNYPKENFLATEMESFCLFYLAKKLNREAACLLTVVDSHFDTRVVSSLERQTSLNTMITLALDSVVSLSK